MRSLLKLCEEGGARLSIMPLFGKKATAEKPAGKVTETAKLEASSPEVDPRLPLNARQVFKLKGNWKGIKRNMEPTGREMFIR